MYFSVRKPQVTPVEPEAQPDEPEALPDDEAGEEADVEETPAPLRPAVRVVWDGCTGPSRWLTHRLGPGPSLGVHAVGVWACGFYGPIAATGIIGSWALAALVLIPREDKDRWADAIERWDARRHAPETLDEEPAGQPETVRIDPHQEYLRWLIDTIGNESGIHLQNLYPKMRELPCQQEHSDAALRGALKTLNVPVRRSLRIGRVAGRSGVRRDDVEALLLRLGEHGPDSDGDAGQAADSPAVHTIGEEVEST